MTENKKYKFFATKDFNGILHDENGNLFFDASVDDNNYGYVSKMSMTYEQSGDNCKDSDGEGYTEPNSLTIETTEEGFLLLKTDRWAFNDLSDLLTIFNDFFKRFPTNVTYEEDKIKIIKDEQKENKD